MITNFVSSFATSDSLRVNIQRMQGEFLKAQTELSTGKLSDRGLGLGTDTGRLTGFDQQQTRLQTLIDTNKLVSTRLDATQNALGTLLADSQSMVKSLISNGNSANGESQIRNQATVQLQSLISNLNLSVNGDFAFGGINVSAKPIADFPGTPAGAARLAIDTAFQSNFGFNQSSASVSGISAASMQSFLDTQFAPLFSASNFRGSWSSASDTPMSSQIAPGQTADTSVSANSSAMRNLVQAYSMLTSLGTDKLGADAYKVVMDQAGKLLGNANTGLIDLQSSIGMTQSSIASASDQLGLQKNILGSAIGNMEDVDPYEANSRVTKLTTQIETAYSLTSRLSQLSLLKYL